MDKNETCKSCYWRQQQEIIERQQNVIKRYASISEALINRLHESDTKRKKWRKSAKLYMRKFGKIDDFTQNQVVKNLEQMERLKEIIKAKDKALAELTNELAAAKEENDTLKRTNKILFDREDGENIDAIIGDDGK